MSERKVLSKYYPPDFDPSKIVRQRGPKQSGPKIQPVRLMAPFSMRCSACGEFIYKGRKFNARKETTDEKYYGITKFRFYIKCTRCSAEITFKTDPKHQDYECERGATRNFEKWREAKLAEETEEEMFDRLEREEAEKDVMKELEMKAYDAQQEKAVDDALDEIRLRNAGREKQAKGEVNTVEVPERDVQRDQEEMEDAEAARRAFAAKIGEEEILPGEEGFFDDGASKVDEQSKPEEKRPAVLGPTNDFKRVVKKKKDMSAALGIKKKALV